MLRSIILAVLTLIRLSQSTPFDTQPRKLEPRIWGPGPDPPLESDRPPTHPDQSQGSSPNKSPDPAPGSTATYTYVPIPDGYVAFGDSYAAGIGTGTTDGDTCRKGEFSYPKLLHGLDDKSDFQNLPCSGATVNKGHGMLSGSPDSQIDAWNNPHVANLATLSIGGNDVGFFPILNACVLHIYRSRSGDCDQEIQKAYNIINGRDLRNDIASVLHQILDKSGKDDFRIFQTNYPTFFNADTESCKWTTFDYWEAGRPWFPWPYRVFLTKELREKLNQLVTDVNTMLRETIDGVNQEYPHQRVWYVDVNPAFEGHRFCEKDVKEPDPNREDTWLFLSGWPDNDGDVVATTDEAFKAIAGPSAQDLKMPDDKTCQASHDWYTLILCGMKEDGEIQADANGGVELTPNSGIKDMPWYLPTRQAKTFHPRKRGHQAYVDAIRRLW